MNDGRVKNLAKRVRENPDDSFSKFALALELLKNNQRQQALILFESIQQNDPDYLGTYYHLGKLYGQLDRTDEARQCFELGIRLAESRGDSRTLSELQEALQELIEDNPNRHD